MAPRVPAGDDVQEKMSFAKLWLYRPRVFEEIKFYLILNSDDAHLDENVESLSNQILWLLYLVIRPIILFVDHRPVISAWADLDMHDAHSLRIVVNRVIILDRHAVGERLEEDCRVAHTHELIWIPEWILVVLHVLDIEASLLELTSPSQPK